LNHFAGLGGAENFCRTDCSEFQIVQRQNLRITLRDGSRQLRHAFHEQHTGEDRLTGKVAFQKRFIAANEILPCSAFSRD